MIFPGFAAVHGQEFHDYPAIRAFLRAEEGHYNDNDEYYSPAENNDNEPGRHRLPPQERIHTVLIAVTNSDPPFGRGIPGASPEISNPHR